MSESEVAIRRRRFLTVSVDDGHPLDERTADLLAKYGLKATFYVPARNPERATLTRGALHRIAQGFEVGGHTYNHTRLRGLAAAHRDAELNDGKAWLDDILGRTSTAFCYPGGKFDRATKEAVKRAGYVGARTCLLNRSDLRQDRFAIGVSTQAHSHSLDVQLRHALREANLRGIWGFAAVGRGTTSWTKHHLRAMDWVERNGGIAHLFLHSWEIDDQNDWGTLDLLLEQMSKRLNFTRVTNGELMQIIADGEA